MYAARRPISLYIPGYADAKVPITAKELSTDGSGHTVWALAVGHLKRRVHRNGHRDRRVHRRCASSPPAPHQGVPGTHTRTLALGPKDAHLKANVNGALVEDDCTIVDGVATCTQAVLLSQGASGSATSTVSTAVNTEAAKAVQVQTNGATGLDVRALVGVGTVFHVLL
ncbi:uncharacterized protein BXZ73DRAFT_97904 [Epithele typhae]|uniref:uncharacterized protein n=1 Tax=Epithele typhae TaxID=378194 RepID=UPI0020081000|nr:uncharacterized protein BXZ73DRAFT_97904 [Epithele typhae]KAH9942494.1 hypothetical protein BXZ73DRAFT_97904 [Epithele typhae]